MKVRGQAGCPPSHPLLPLAHNHPSLSSPRWSLHKLERKHGGARNHWPARPSLRLATAWSGSSGYRLWRTEEEEVRSCGAWGAARPRWVLRQAAGAGAPPPPTHPQAKATRTQPTRCLDLSQPEKKDHQKVPVWKTILHPDCKAQRHKREGGMEGINLVARPWQMPC